MDGNDHPLAQAHEALDRYGMTAEEAIAEEFEQQGELLTDLLHAKDRHEGRVTVHGTHNPTPKADRTPPKVIPDPETQTAAERYRGKKPIEEREAPKPGARIYPRMKYRANDPSAIRNR